MSRERIVRWSLVLLGGLVLPVAGLAGCEDEEATPPPAGAVEQAGRFVNTRCPIMDVEIDPDDVPPDLVRTFEGHRVAFCCAQCPPEWDRLSDQEKREKLVAASPPGALGSPQGETP